jgi:hypothetical protein
LFLWGTRACIQTIPEIPHENSDFNAKASIEDTFRSTIMRVYMKLVMIMELEQ